MSFADNTDTGHATPVQLREGLEDAPLFFFPGGDADPNQLADLASRMRNPKAMIGIEFCRRDNDDRFPTTVAIMADRSCSAIRALQPSGPFYLVGYSFGGLVAIEVARLFRESGEEIAFLGLIDTFFDLRYWPTGIFLRSHARLIRRHLATLLCLPPRTAITMLNYRARRFFTRFLARQKVQPLIIETPKTGLVSALDHCMAAMSNYLPKNYSGRITLFNAENDTHGCNLTELWRDVASEIECWTISGSTHGSIVRDDTSLTNLASALNSGLKDPNPATGCTCGSGHAPRVLLTTAHRWLTTTRLAFALSEAGFRVEALCPAGHSLARVKFVTTTYRYSALRLGSLRDAIEASKPDLIIPTDDYTAVQLHELHALTNDIDAASAKLRLLIARSLGDPEQFPILYARDRISSLAHAAGVPCLTAALISDENELLSQLDRIGFPAVLKTDGSSGGRGVAIVHNQVDARRAFRRLAAPPSLVRALKRLIIDGDANFVLPCLLRDRAQVTIQRFMPGRPANAAVACWEGEVLAQVCVEVLASNGATGPATVVKVVAHQGISQAVERMTRRLKLSGLCGFDFILDPTDGSAHLIELNPRATQTSHLVSSDCKQLLVLLAAKSQGLPFVDSPRSPNYGPIVLFPHGFACDPKSPYSQYVDSDLPQKSPEFVKLGLEVRRQQHRFLIKTIRCTREYVSDWITHKISRTFGIGGSF